MSDVRSSSTGRALVALVCVGITMATLDASIVNIALPSIARAFGTPLTGTIEWVLIAYLVVMGAVLLSAGRLSDLIGRKPVWMTGLLLFIAGSAACGAAPTLPLLIAARAIQGAGSGLLFSTSTAILMDAVPATVRGRALGWASVAAAVGASAGPSIGGVIVQQLSWRWIFFVNLPIGAAAILASQWLLPAAGPRKVGRLDPRGAFLLALAVTGLNVGLSFGHEWGWTSLRIFAALGIGTLALASAVRHERRAAMPILDLALFRSPIFTSALASLLLSMLALFAVGFLMPFYFEELRHFSTTRAGLMLTPYPLALAVVAPLAGRLADRFGSRWLAPLALAITAAALLLLAEIDATTSTSGLILRLALAGVGVGLFQAPNTRALMSAAPKTKQGMAGGMLATARVTGQALSIAVAGAVFLGLGGAGLVIGQGGAMIQMDPASGGDTTFLRGFHAALIVCAGSAALGAVVALLRGPERAAVPRPGRHPSTVLS